MSNEEMKLKGSDVQIIEHPLIHDNKYIADKDARKLYVPNIYSFIFKMSGLTYTFEQATDYCIQIAKDRVSECINTPLTNQ